MAVFSLRTCHVLLHLRHLYCWSCLLCLGLPLTKSEKKAGEKRPNERETIASTSQRVIGRSTRQTLDDPHCLQCSAKGFCSFIFLSLWFFRLLIAFSCRNLGPVPGLSCRSFLVELEVLLVKAGWAGRDPPCRIARRVTADQFCKQLSRDHLLLL
jgi:hypothetical protein